MERFFPTAICLAMLIGISACSGVQQKQEDSERFCRLVDMAANPGDMELIFKGVESGHPAILKIPQGMELPLQIDLTAPFVRLSQEQVILRFIAAQDFYIMLKKEGTKISLDGRSWVDAKNIASVKSLLGFHQGVFKMALAYGQSGEALFVLDISTQ